MKRLLILLLVFSSCKKEAFYYPSKTFFDEKNPTEIKINDLDFKQITDSVRKGLYDEKYHFIKIEKSNKTYRISPFAYTYGLYKYRNSLKIEGDSIRFSDSKFPLRDLSKYLKMYYESDGKDYRLPVSYDRTYIRLTLKKDLRSKKFNDILLSIVKMINNTEMNNKDSINFNIMLDYPLPIPKTKPPKPAPLEIID